MRGIEGVVLVAVGGRGCGEVQTTAGPAAEVGVAAALGVRDGGFADVPVPRPGLIDRVGDGEHEDFGDVGDAGGGDPGFFVASSG